MNGLFRRSIEEKVPLEMIYLSEEGVITQRKILVKEVTPNYIKAFCFSRKQIRTFKREQILSIFIAKSNRRLIG